MGPAASSAGQNELIVYQEGVMMYQKKWIILAVLIMLGAAPAYSEEATKEQVKGLDEQVQEIKGDVLAISTELNQLEEKLMYPSNTQVAVFVSMQAGDLFRLDSLEVQLDGKPVAYYLYSFKELEAIQKGGLQRIFTGNITTGVHDMKVTAMGKTRGGTDFAKAESFKVTKDITPKIVEVNLSGHGISFKDR